MSLLAVLTIVAAGIGGFILARNFVRGRLRYVDAIYSPFAPWVVGAIGALVAWPAALLPLVTGATSAVFGVGVGLGTASGVRALKRGGAGT